MAKKVQVKGFKEFMDTVEKYNGTETFVLFTGSKGEDGKSWCPDCVVADPVIEKCSNKAPKDTVLITCEVGERTYWKDQQNEFRTHDKLRLTGVPTLLKWGESKKLVESNCAKEDLVSMFFEED